MPDEPCFRFATAGTIVFGPGSLPRVEEKLPPEGAVLVVTGKDVSRAGPLLELIEGHGLEALVFPVSREPDIETVSRAREAGAAAGCRAVIALGGGSALDAGKAAAALIANPGDPLDYLEVVGAGKPLRFPPLPFIAVPTTAGTGSEATRNAVISCPERSVKVSLRSYLLLPALAVVDPELALTLPPRPTAESGMDALAQLLEGFISRRANPLTDALAREGLRAAGRGLLRAYRHGSDLAARTEMALAALCSGMVLANAGLGAPHGFAGPLGGTFPVPHGAACARLLAPALAVTLEALRRRDPGSPAEGRLAEAARLLSGREKAGAGDAVAWTAETARALEIRPLSSFGVTRADIPDLIEKAGRSSSMKGNPISLTAEEMTRILEEAIG